MQTRTLPNGLRIVLIEDHALPLVAVRAVVGVDSLDDPVGKEGLFILTAGMLREGTMSMSADQLAAAAASLGNVVFPLPFGPSNTRMFPAGTVSVMFERARV